MIINAMIDFSKYTLGQLRSLRLFIDAELDRRADLAEGRATSNDFTMDANSRCRNAGNLVRVAWELPTGSGNRTGWAKTVTGCDPTQGANARAFSGDFLPVDGKGPSRLAIGTLIAEVRPIGTMRKPRNTIRLMRVDERGQLTLVVDEEHRKEWVWPDASSAFFAHVAKALRAR